MVRKLILASLLAAATLGGTATAQSPAFGDRDRHDHRDEARDRRHNSRYRVSIRHFTHWHAYRTYADRDDAYRVARYLERRGYDAKVERAHGW